MITIKPVNGYQAEIEAEGQIFGQFHSEDATAAMETLNAQYPGQCELSIKANGYSAVTDVVDKALELAGLDSFNAAKMTSIGKVVF